MPKDVPASVLRRINLSVFSNDTRKDYNTKELIDKTNHISNEFENSALDIHETARQVSAQRIQKRISNGGGDQASMPVASVNSIA